MLTRQIKTRLAQLQIELKELKEQLIIYKPIKIGTLIYTESCYILTARDGVAAWHHSNEPALLRYIRDNYGSLTSTLDVVASDDPLPYNPPCQIPYSGRKAELRGPHTSIKIVSKDDLLLYMHLKHKTTLFERLLKTHAVLPHQQT